MAKREGGNKLKSGSPQKPHRSSAIRLCWASAIATAFFSSCPLASTSAAPDLTDLALEDLLRVDVVSASRFSQSTSEAPASVTVIGEDELRQRGYRNLAEALVTLPGVYASNDRDYTSLGVRGFNRPGDYGTRILLLTDGARRNDPVYDQALFGNEAPIEIDWVKRLEFVSGPASAAYGSNALFGTVNAVMLGGGDINGSRVTVDAGTNNSRRVGLVAGQRLEGDQEWFLGFAAYKASGGDFYFPEFDNGLTNGHARGLDGEGYQKAYAKFRSGNWRLIGNYSSRDKDIPTAWYGTSFGESGTRTRDESGLLEINYDGDVVNGWQPSLRAFSGRYRFDGSYKYTPPPNAKDLAAADWFGSELHLSYSDIAQHKLMFGIDTQWNTRVEQRYFAVDSGSMILETNNPSRVVSFFAQDEWNFHPDWLLNVGLRHDKVSDFAAETSPRIALIWQATQRLSFKAMAGSAYRVPNAYERFYGDKTSLVGNPALQPEHIRSTELAAAYRFGQNGRLGASFYRNQMRNLIEIDPSADPAGISGYSNSQRIHSEGVEIDAENRWLGGYRLRGSVAWQQSRQDDGSTLVDSPRLIGKFVFGVPVAFGWSASGEWLGLSSRQGENAPVAGYGIANLSLSSAADARLGQISLQIRNLGDRRYADPTSSYMVQRAVEQDGRQFNLRWTLAL
jgi:outer membrane receptor protein involved in Fe transport